MTLLYTSHIKKYYFFFLDFVFENASEDNTTNLSSG